jgi:hypothetical protein
MLYHPSVQQTRPLTHFLTSQYSIGHFLERLHIDLTDSIQIRMDCSDLMQVLHMSKII